MRTCPNPACPDRVGLGLAGEYVDSVTVCPQCGTPLIDATSAAENAASPEAPEAEIEMVCVLRTDDEGLASLVKSMFDGDGIRCVVRGEGLQDLLGWAASTDSLHRRPGRVSRPSGRCRPSEHAPAGGSIGPGGRDHQVGRRSTSSVCPRRPPAQREDGWTRRYDPLTHG